MKSFLMVNGKLVLAITVVVIASFLFGSVCSCKAIEVNNEQVQRIKTALSVVKDIANFAITDDKIRSIFNTSINIAQSGTDVSYGFLVLSALNEFDLIDLVTSQRYKVNARDYFNIVLDERINLIKEAKGIGFDILKLATSKTITGPTSALVLETFSVIDKTIAIFSTLNVLRQEILYDGIWRYFDSRRWGELHSVAWEDAEAEMGFIVVKNSLRLGKQMVDENSNQLALQFAILWQKWGPYTNSFGITMETRKEFNQDMILLIEEGSKNSSLVDNQSNSSSIISLGQIAEGVVKIWNWLKNLVSQLNFKAATGFLISQTPIVIPTPSTKQLVPSINSSPFPSPSLAPILTPSPFSSPIPSITPTPSLTPSPTPSLTPSPTPSLNPSPSPRITPSPSPLLVVKCEKLLGSLPAKNKVIFNEIAWMGTSNSANDEWIELKNISGSQVDLTNWQLLDKNQDIKITFPKGAKLLNNGVFLLERTDDETIPGKVADLIYTGGLSNTDEALYLFDGNCQLQDEALANPNWPAGDNSLKGTMERKVDLSWQTSANPGGTPKSENSQGIYIGGGGSSLSASPSPIASVSPSPNPSPSPSVSPSPSPSLSPSPLPSPSPSLSPSPSPTPLPSSSPSPSISPSPNPSPLPSPSPSLSPSPTPTPTPTLEVVINEIAWAGTKAESNDEWIELYNNTGGNIDLEGWVLKTIDGTPEIELMGVIKSQDYFLLERTNDTTISNIIADLIYTGALENNPNCEVLSLYDPEDNLIDQTVCTGSDWPAGKASPDYISMERINSAILGTSSANWANNNLITRNGLDAGGPANNINGTPKAKNSVSTSPTTVFSLPFNEFSEITLTYLGSPYIINSPISVPLGNILNIQPGVALKFVASNGSSLEVKGVLKAISQEGKEIVFTSTDDNYWLGITFESDLQESEISSQLEYVKVEKARSLEFGIHSAIKVNKKAISFKNSSLIYGFNFRGLYLINSSSVVENVTFTNFNGPYHYSTAEYPSAVYIQGGSSTIKTSIFKNNTYGIRIEWEAGSIIEGNYFEENEKPIYASSSYPSLTGNQFLNNDINGILITGSLSQNTTWKTGITYIIDNQLIIASGVKLIIDPGTIIKFKSTSDPWTRGKFIINGQVLAEGIDSQPIVFTSQNDNLGDSASSYKQDTQGVQGPAYSGDWHYIEINTALNPDSVFDNIVIRYGGIAIDFMSEKGSFRILNSSPIIKNSIFDNNRVAGIYLNNANGAMLENLILQNHTAIYGNNHLSSVGMWIRDGGLPTMNNLQITNNSYGIYWPSGNCDDLTGNATINCSQNTIENTYCGCCPL